MTSAMLRILSRSASAPASSVLSKTSTPLMKMQEKELALQQATKTKRLQRKNTNLSCMVVPTLLGTDVKIIEGERELRRKATRGVVALFNAISQYQKGERDKEKEKAEGGGGGKKKDSEEGQRAKKSEFLGLIKSKATGAVEEKKTKATEDEGEDEDEDEEQNKKSKWLRDDFMTKSTGKLKDWDKDSESDSGDSGESDVDVGDGDLDNARGDDKKSEREHDKKMRYGRLIDNEEKKKKRSGAGGGGGGKKKKR